MYSGGAIMCVADPLSFVNIPFYSEVIIMII